MIKGKSDPLSRGSPGLVKGHGQGIWDGSDHQNLFEGGSRHGSRHGSKNILLVLVSEAISDLLELAEANGRLV